MAHSSEIGIGVEKEIYSNPYLSYHYGYKKLVSHSTNDLLNSKISKIEKELFSTFKDIDFILLLLNYSRKGSFVNFTLTNEITELEKERLFIKPFGDARSFTIPFNNKEFKHREIYPTVGSDGTGFIYQFDLNDKTAYTTHTILDECEPAFYCTSFNVCNSVPDFNDIHLEVYPRKNIDSSKQVLRYLQKCGCEDISRYEKYILNYKKFSHVKFRVVDGEIINVKYYRAINVNIPDFYND